MSIFILILFTCLFIWAVIRNNKLKKKITAYEKKEGHSWINEGYIKKGGQNLNPPSDRPPPPSSHKLAIPNMDMNVPVLKNSKPPSKTID